MSDRHERMARIEGIDLETGAFQMTLATEGEASDGDILSIKGGHVPERMPMLTSHWNDPSAQLGSITNPEKLLKDSPPRLRAVGHIEMSGEGVSAEIRRDLAHMIDKGHVTGVSIRWDGVPDKPPVRRVNLPSDHAYFVDAETEKDHRKRYGLFFEEWRAMEGSVVALGADPQALIGRAYDNPEGEVREFWKRMALECTDALQEPEDESPAAKIAASLAALRIDAADCREAGASHADCINAVTDGTDTKIEAVELGDFVVFLPEPEAEAVRALVEIEVEADPEALELDPEPAPEAREDQPSPLSLDPAQVRDPINPEALAALMSDALDKYAERLERNVQALFDLHTGKV